jgi:hypothetical protein
MPTQHPLRGVELRLLSALHRAQPDTEYVFTSERSAPWTTSNFGHRSPASTEVYTTQAAHRFKDFWED